MEFENFPRNSFETAFKIEKQIKLNREIFDERKRTKNMRKICPPYGQCSFAAKCNDGKNT